MAAGGGSLATGLDAGHRGGTIRESMGVATMSRTTMANRHADDSAASGPPAGSRITSRHMHVPDDDDGRLSPSRKPGLGERGGPSICSTFLSDFPYPSAEGRLAGGRRGGEAALLGSSLRAQLAAQHEPSDGIDGTGASSSLE